MITTDPAPTTSKSSTMIAVVLIIICIGAFLRFYNLSTESYWFDEIVMLKVTATSQGVADTLALGRAPLLVLLGYTWTQWFGNSEVAVRVLPAIFGTLLLPVMFYIGRQLFNYQVALIVTILITLSGFHIYHAQDFRYYSLFLFMTVASYYFYIQFLEHGKRRHLILYVAYSILTYYSHTYGVFVLAAQGIYFLLMWRKYKNLRLMWFISQVLIVIGILPHLWLFLTLQLGGEGEETGGAWLAERRNMGPVYTMVKFLFYDYGYFRPIPLLTSALILLAGIISIPLMHGRVQWLNAIKGIRNDVAQVTSHNWSNLILVLCWFGVTIFTPAILTMLYKPMYDHRYVISASPAFYLLVALVIVTLGRVIPVAASVGALLAIMLPGLLNYYAEPTKEQWREAAAYIQENASDDDVLVISYPRDVGGLIAATNDAFDWYYRGNLPRCPLVDDQMGNGETASSLADCIAGHDQIWVVARELADPDLRSQRIIGFFDTLLADGEYEVTQIDFYGTPVYRFNLQANALAMDS